MFRTVRALWVCSLALIFVAPMAAQEAPARPAKTLAERLGYPANSRLLIIHADDFGMMHSVNTAIEEAFEKHWITSASILVPCPWFPEVAQWAKAHPEADLGIHLALNADWTSYRWPSIAPQSKVSSLLDADGYLPLTTEYVAAHAKMPEVETETHAQVDKAKAAGIHITHVDTHMGTIVSTDDLIKVYLGTAQSYKVPAMLIQPRGNQATDLGRFHLAPETIVLDNLIEIMPGRFEGGVAERLQENVAAASLRGLINWLCTWRITTRRCRARRSIIRTGARNGGRMISIWCAARNSSNF